MGHHFGDGDRFLFNVGKLRPKQGHWLRIREQSTLHTDGHCQRDDSLGCAEQHLQRLVVIGHDPIDVSPASGQIHHFFAVMKHTETCADIGAIGEHAAEGIPHMPPTGSDVTLERRRHILRASRSGSATTRFAASRSGRSDSPEAS